MDDDQQFCLRWNNHQSTLISVFDTLLENGTLVDCTLAAEGKFLKAHKVVLSACSPYFATLLSQQYDKHPIFILKDVKFQELRAMMDYMYRGEVNISQDQLAALLKAAESLQIKGLSDSRSGGNSIGGGGSGVGPKSAAEHKPLSVPVASAAMKGASPSGFTIEQKRPRHTIGGPSSIESQSGSREGSSSPTSRKRKKMRRRSIDNINADNHEHSNSSSQSMKINSSVPQSNTSATAITSVQSAVVSATQQQQQQAAIGGSGGGAAAAAGSGLNVTKKTDSISSNTKLETTGTEHDLDTENGNEHDDNIGKSINARKEQNHKRKQHAADVDDGKDGGEILIEPKSEYEEGNDETVEDLTLDDEELLEDLDQAGPSHGGGEGSSQGYAQWQVDRSQDDVFMATQEAAGQQRDPQGSTPNTNTTYARIRVKNWLMMTDQAITGANKETNQEPEPTPTIDEPTQIKKKRMNNNKDENNAVATADIVGNNERNDEVNNIDNGSDCGDVTIKIERTSPSPSIGAESIKSDDNADFNYDIKVSSPMSWAFEPIKTEKSLMSDVTTTVYAAVKKTRSRSGNSPGSLGIRSKPMRVLQSQSGNDDQPAGDKKYRILFQNSRIRKESLEHSDDMIYNANYEKPWICRNCNRNYKWKNSLKCHLKNECGQPPRYFCNKMCGYRTNVHSNLKRHLNTKCKNRDTEDDNV